MQIKGPNKPKDSFASGQLDLPDTLGGDSVKAAADAAGEKVSQSHVSCSKSMTADTCNYRMSMLDCQC